MTSQMGHRAKAAARHQGRTKRGRGGVGEFIRGSTALRKAHSKTEFQNKNSEKKFRKIETFSPRKFDPATGITSDVVKVKGAESGHPRSPDLRNDTGTAISLISGQQNKATHTGVTYSTIWFVFPPSGWHCWPSLERRVGDSSTCLSQHKSQDKSQMLASVATSTDTSSSRPPSSQFATKLLEVTTGFTKTSQQESQRGQRCWSVTSGSRKTSRRCSVASHVSDIDTVHHADMQPLGALAKWTCSAREDNARELESCTRTRSGAI